MASPTHDGADEYTKELDQRQLDAEVIGQQPHETITPPHAFPIPQPQAFVQVTPSPTASPLPHDYEAQSVHLPMNPLRPMLATAGPGLIIPISQSTVTPGNATTSMESAHTIIHPSTLGTPLLVKDFAIDLSATSLRGDNYNHGLVTLGPNILVGSFNTQGLHPERLSTPLSTVQVSIYANAFIPNDWIPIPMLAGQQAKGDNRRIGERDKEKGEKFGSSRMWATMVVEIGEDAGQPPIVSKDGDIAPTSHRIPTPTLRELEEIYRKAETVTDSKTGKKYRQKTARGTIVTKELDARKNSPNVTSVRLRMAAKEAFWEGLSKDIVPAIDFSYSCTFWWDTEVIHYMLTGEHDGFPCHEVWIQDMLVYGYDPREKSKESAPFGDPGGAKLVYGNGKGPFALGGDMEIKVKHSGVVLAIER